MNEATEASTVDRVHTRKQFADALGISLSTFARMEDKGELPPRVLLSERRVGYRTSAINAFIESRTQVAAA